MLNILEIDASSILEFMTDNIIFIIIIIVLIVVLVALLFMAKSRKKSKEKGINTISNNQTENNSIPEGIPSVNEPIAPQTNINNVPVDTVSAAPDLMAASNAPINNAPINEVIPDKQFINEEPALNMQEADMPKTATYAPEQEINNGPAVNNNMINAFEMPAPAVNNVEVNEIKDPLQTNPAPSNTPETKTETLEESVAPAQAPANEPVIPTPQPETIENPQVVNEAINNDITVTKKCPSCGTENPYINKTCQNCGNALE